MTEHVTTWLGAYLDGELSWQRQLYVQAHLEGCEQCRAELAKLQSLSVLLHKWPEMSQLTAPDRFVAEVSQRLPNRQRGAISRHILERGWQLAPLILLCGWSFFQAISIVSDLALLVLSTGLGRDVVDKLPLVSIVGRDLSGLAGISTTQTIASVIQILGHIGPWNWVAAINFAMLVVFALLYWGWLTSWHVRQH